MFLRLDKIFEETLLPLTSNKQLRAYLAFYYWRDIVGERIAKVASPDRINGKTLYVKTRSSSWAQELSLLKPHILKELNAKLGENLFTNIHFSNGLSLTKKNSSFTMTPWTEISLSKEELLWIEEEISPIADLDLQEIVRNVRIKEEKLKKYKVRKGFVPCKNCGLLIQPENGCSNCLNSP